MLKLIVIHHLSIADSIIFAEFIYALEIEVVTDAIVELWFKISRLILFIS